MSILAHDLTQDEIKTIKQRLDNISYDEYAGFSPEQQNIHKEVKKIVGNKALEFTTLS